MNETEVLQWLNNRYSTRWKQAASPNDSCESAIARLMEACSGWLQQQDQSTPEQEKALFARIVLDYIADKGRSLQQKTVEYICDHYCKPAFPKYFAILVAATHENVPVAFSDDNAVDVKRRLAEEFFEAAETRPGNLVSDLGRFKQREIAFLTRKDLTDESFRVHTRKLMDLNQADFSTLLSRCSLRKWRTYEDKKLVQIGTNFKQWHSLVQVLIEKRVIDESLQRHVDGLKRKITDAVQRYGQWDPQNLAIQIDTAFHEKLRHYTYEAALPTFLTKIVLNASRSVVSVSPNWSESLDHGDKTRDVADPDQHEVWLDLLDEWIARYLLSVCTFTADTRPALSVIWQEMLDKAIADTAGQTASNEVIAERIKRELGEHRTPANVSLLRNRLKKRIGCVEYVFVQEPDPHEETNDAGTAEALPEDGTLIGAIKAELGEDAQDSQIRRLASLARTARWIHNIYHVIRSVLAMESRNLSWQVAVNVFMQSQRKPPGGMGDVTAQESTKLIRLCEFDHRDLRAALKTARVGFLEEALLILSVGEKLPPTSIVRALRLSGEDSVAVLVACQ